MFRVLLDENIPLGLCRRLDRFEAWHVSQLGWDGIDNGLLITAAEREGFQVLVTADRNLRYQQNLERRRVALVVLSTNHWDTIRRRVDVVRDAVARAGSGTYEEVELPS